jgi:hypothetical protein
LLGFDFHVEFKSAATNVVADALSRRDTEAAAMMFALSAPSFWLFDELRGQCAANPTQISLRREIHGVCVDKWALVDNLVTYGGHVLISALSPSLSEILAGAHGAGHEGMQKTLHLLCVDFFNPGTHTIAQGFVCVCATC